MTKELEGSPETVALYRTIGGGYALGQSDTPTDEAIIYTLEVTARNEAIEEVATKTAGVAVDVMFSGKTAPADYAEAYADAIRALKTESTT